MGELKVMEMDTQKAGSLVLMRADKSAGWKEFERVVRWATKKAAVMAGL